MVIVVNSKELRKKDLLEFVCVCVLCLASLLYLNTEMSNCLHLIRFVVVRDIP